MNRPERRPTPIDDRTAEALLTGRRVEGFADVTAALLTVRSLARTASPAPSPALEALLTTGVPLPERAPLVRAATRRVFARVSLVAAACGGLLSTAVAANALPAPVQRAVATVVETVTPLTVPRPLPVVKSQAPAAPLPVEEDVPAPEPVLPALAPVPAPEPLVELPPTPEPPAVVAAVPVGPVATAAETAAAAAPDIEPVEEETLGTAPPEEDEPAPDGEEAPRDKDGLEPGPGEEPSPEPTGSEEPSDPPSEEPGEPGEQPGEEPEPEPTPTTTGSPVDDSPSVADWARRR